MNWFSIVCSNLWECREDSFVVEWNPSDSQFHLNFCCSFKNNLKTNMLVFDGQITELFNHQIQKNERFSIKIFVKDFKVYFHPFPIFESIFFYKRGYLRSVQVLYQNNFKESDPPPLSTNEWGSRPFRPPST